MGFTPVPYHQEYQLYKNQAAKFPAILDNFYLMLAVSSKFQQGWVVMAEGEKVVKFLKRARRVWGVFSQVMGHSVL